MFLYEILRIVKNTSFNDENGFFLTALLHVLSTPELCSIVGMLRLQRTNLCLQMESRAPSRLSNQPSVRMNTSYAKGYICHIIPCLRQQMKNLKAFQNSQHLLYQIPCRKTIPNQKHMLHRRAFICQHLRGSILSDEGIRKTGVGHCSFCPSALYKSVYAKRRDLSAFQHHPFMCHI